MLTTGILPLAFNPRAGAERRRDNDLVCGACPFELPRRESMPQLTTSARMTLAFNSRAGAR